MEAAGDVSNLDKAGEIYAATASYGQGITVTPLQMVSAFAAIANGGRLYKPQLVLALTDANGALARKIQPELIRQIPVDAENLAIVREGMRLAVQRGTAERANALPTASSLP